MHGATIKTMGIISITVIRITDYEKPR